MVLSDVDLHSFLTGITPSDPFSPAGPNQRFFISLSSSCLLHLRLLPFSLSKKFWYTCLTDLHLSQAVSVSCYYCPLSPPLPVLVTRHSDSCHLFIISLLVKITNRKGICSPSCSSNSSHLIFCLFLVSFSHFTLLTYYISGSFKSWLPFRPGLPVRAVSSLPSFLSHTLISLSFLFSFSFFSKNSFYWPSISSNCQGHLVKIY